MVVDRQFYFFDIAPVIGIDMIKGPLAQAVEHLTFNQVVSGSSPEWLSELGPLKLNVSRAFLLNNEYCGYGGIGRHARFRFWCASVQVQILLSAYKKGC